MQKQVGCFNHRVITMVAGKLERQWVHSNKRGIVLTHFGYLISYAFPHDWTISLANYSPMTFTNVLENQIKF